MTAAGTITGFLEITIEGGEVTVDHHFWDGAGWGVDVVSGHGVLGLIDLGHQHHINNMQALVASDDHSRCVLPEGGRMKSG